MKKIHLGIIAAVIVIVIATSVFQYYTTQTAMSQAEDFLDSSLEKYAQAMEYWDENDYVGARIKLAGAKTDVEESKKYLEEADIKPSEKQVALRWCDAWSNLIEWASCLSDAFEDYGQAMLRLDYEDWGGATSKFLDAKEDIDRAQTYFLSAKEDLDSIDVEVLPPELRSDVVEGQAYFAEYETLLPDFSDMIDVFIPLCYAWSNLIEMTSYWSDASEDYEQARSRLGYEDWDGAVTKFLDAKEDIDHAQSYFLSAKEDFDSIDVEALPPELKSSVTEAQAYFAEYETLLPDFNDMIDVFIPFIRGMGHLLEGVNYLERYDWHAAKLAFEDSLSKISEAKSKLDDLRYCETAEFSSLAAGLYSGAETIEEALAHYITGCEYAEAGYYSNATTEFETGTQIFEGFSWD